MWVALFMALITYLLSPKGDDGERRKALLAAAAVGGGAYLATEYTDWGKDISNSFDSAIGIGGTTTTADGSKTDVKVNPSTGTSGWPSWLTPVIAGGAVGAAAGSGGIPSWLIIGGVLLGGYLLLKD